jgi:hypothetical protein
MNAAEARQKVAARMLEVTNRLGHDMVHEAEISVFNGGCPAQLQIEQDLIRAEFRAIECWLRRRACLGDKRLTNALEHEMGRQVKPTGKAAKAMERLVRRTKDKG